ncbi:MAG: hypothetical protein ACXV3A_02625 [Kineosporiaceae bacterium]
MAEVGDGYDTYYAERLWQLLPAVYRTADTDSFDAPGPLRELLGRIGAQVAVVRRSIDRLWADQSIETCDDWVIPYIGDLLGTNLVNNLDAPAQRLDVAKTIRYRRRKGTPEVLEELARDVTGWTAHVVEGFRRLARTRHGLDPAVGPAAFPRASPAYVAQLLQIEGLTGLLTGGPAGGFADLRSRHGAALANTAFGESFHTADVRAGCGALGHFGIPKLVVFVWRLTSFPVVKGTPVAVAGCPGQYVFDPTGREIPLFLPDPPGLDDFSESWTPAHEWQVPGPLTRSLETAITDTGTSPPLPLRPPYPDAGVPPRYGLHGGAQLASIWPEIGRFATAGTPPGPITVDYHYGFPSMIGAGPYDRDLLGDPPGVVGAQTVVTGGTGLDAALTAAGATGTVTVGDSRAPDSPTYTTLTGTTLPGVGSSAEPIVSLLLRAGPGMRPVLRPAAGAAPWVFTGGGEAQLVLDGLTVSGCDIVLRGSFDTVRITACTVDPGTAGPGTAGPGSPPLATAADGTPLAPSRIFVEADPAAPPGGGGAIRQLLVDHCILGPVRTRFGGSVETLTITDSIVQGLPATTGPACTAADVFDPPLLARGLLANDPLSLALLAAMPQAAATALRAYAAEPRASQEPGLPQVVLGGLNALVDGPSLYDAALFATVELSAGVLALAAGAATLGPAQLAALNRGLIGESFPVALGVAALAVADATVQLTRVTVLGRIAARRLSASDSILGDLAAVDDVQHGWVRFSAYASGSAIPRQYESAAIPPGAPIFTTDSYGQPGYAQLLETADAAIVGGAGGASISSGAGKNSEMGAFSADLNPVKEQGLLIKYEEYMPLGITPVIVHVT